MQEIAKEIGARIRKYRKQQGMTLDQMAREIHKSKATVSKYESGDIVIDIDTLYSISCVLHIPLGRLADMPLPGGSKEPAEPEQEAALFATGPFFRTKQLYFYFYDGRYKRLMDGIIQIGERKNSVMYQADLSLCVVSDNGRSRETHYTGEVFYSGMLIRFSFINQTNSLEQDLLYIFNPLEARDSTEGLFCGISSADLRPCAFKCLVTLTQQPLDDRLRRDLLFTDREIRRMRKLNMLMVDNRYTDEG